MKPTKVERWLECSQQNTPYELDFYTPFKEMVRQELPDGDLVNAKRKRAPSFLTPFVLSKSLSEGSDDVDAVSFSRSSDKYRRRKRLKVRKDRFVYKEGKKAARPTASKSVNQSKLNPRRTMRARTHAQNKFQAPNAVSSRLTLKSKTGLFKGGRASAPVARSGVPDLAFSEQAFLNLTRAWAKENSRCQAENGLATEPKPTHRHRGRRQEEEAHISRYFGAQAQDRVGDPYNDARICFGGLDYETPCKPSKGEHKLRSSPAVDLELPGRPYLGFGKQGPLALKKMAGGTRIHQQTSKELSDGNIEIDLQKGIFQSPVKDSPTVTYKNRINKHRLISDPRAQHSPISNFAFAQKQTFLQDQKEKFPSSRPGPQLATDKQEEILELLRGLYQRSRQPEARVLPKTPYNGSRHCEDQSYEPERGENSKCILVNASQLRRDRSVESRGVDHAEKNTLSELEVPKYDQQDNLAPSTCNSAASDSPPTGQTNVQDSSKSQIDSDFEPTHQDAAVQTIDKKELHAGSHHSAEPASADAPALADDSSSAGLSSRNSIKEPAQILLSHSTSMQPSPSLQTKNWVNSSFGRIEPVLDSIPAIGFVKPASETSLQQVQSAIRLTHTPGNCPIYERQLQLDDVNKRDRQHNESSRVRPATNTCHETSQFSQLPLRFPPSLDNRFGNSTVSRPLGLFKWRHGTLPEYQAERLQPNLAARDSNQPQDSSSLMDADVCHWIDPSMQLDYLDSELGEGIYEENGMTKEQNATKAFGKGFGASNFQDDEGSGEMRTKSPKSFQSLGMAIGTGVNAGFPVLTFWRPNLLY